MDLLQEYKELYYKEIEFSDRLNGKITTCITFLTVLGSAQILIWTQLKNFEVAWYTMVYIGFCSLSTILFFITVFFFFRTYSGYKTQIFPIKEIALQNMEVLNKVRPEQVDDAYKVLSQKMAERFINDAIHNRKVNKQKNERHRRLIKIIMSTFLITFFTFAINVCIDYHETKVNKEMPIEIYIEGGELNVK